MARKATSVSELEQIERVRALLQDAGPIPSARLEVITAAGRRYVGHLLKAVMGSSPKIGGWDAFGRLTLGGDEGKVEIDFLDVVTVSRMTQATPLLISFQGRKRLHVNGKKRQRSDSKRRLAANQHAIGPRKRASVAAKL